MELIKRIIGILAAIILGGLIIFVVFSLIGSILSLIGHILVSIFG